MNFTIVRRIGYLAVAGLIFFSASCGDNQRDNLKIEGIDGPHIALHQDQILITTVFEKIQIDGGLRYNLPKFENSYIEVSPDLQSDGTLMAVNISINDLLGDLAEILDPQTLPGGRALPGVSGGSLPALAFTIKAWNNMTVYLGKDVFGIFYPFNLDIDGAIATFRFYIGEKKAGNISLVGKDNDGENSGVLLLLEMDATTKKLLRKRARKYGHRLN
ncbi:MAG: hypothetical protein CME70_15145 [Halobacteriovorax sp.]|nr:hypothetical protein [Halobacteriovorax sp.]|tara:strand:- start:98637 stop:99287 length:651 start_codon:yes stop_codon:yes gene_type:complete